MEQFVEKVPLVREPMCETLCAIVSVDSCGFSSLLVITCPVTIPRSTLRDGRELTLDEQRESKPGVRCPQC